MTLDLEDLAFLGGLTPPATGPASLLILNGNSSPIVDTSAYGWTVTASGSPAPSVSTSGEFFPSIYFPNNAGSRLTLPSDNLFRFGTGDFTAEVFLYQRASNQFSTVLEIGNHLGSTGIAFLVGNGLARVYSSAFFGTGAISLNTINHIAWVRQSGVLNTYVNGPRTSSVSFALNNLSTSGPVTIGNIFNNTITYALEGNMRLRLTASALYSGTSLTVPTAF